MESVAFWTACLLELGLQLLGERAKTSIVRHDLAFVVPRRSDWAGEHAGESLQFR